MTTTVRINKFKAPNFSIGRYQRRDFQIFDANLHYGDVRPFACPELVCEDVGRLNKLYPLPECECLGFDDTVTDIVRGFCHDQYFVLAEGNLYQATTETLCRGVVDCLAGAPHSTESPVATSTCETYVEPVLDENGDVIEEGYFEPKGCEGYGVSYVVTYVAEHAGIEVESAPSPPSEVVPVTTDRHGTVVTWGEPPVAGHCIVGTRLYRSETTFQDADGVNGMVEGSEWVLVAEFIGTDTRSFTDNVASHETGGPLLTYMPMPFVAPKGGLVGLARTDDGIVVAEKHRVYISEAGKPMFTFDGVAEVEDEIRAIRAIGNNVFIFTNHRPYKIGYRHTEGTISIERKITERDIPLASVNSLAVWGSKIFFASTYALYEWDIGGYGADIRSTTSQMITPEQWRNIKPETVRGVAYEYGYMFSCDGLEYALMIEYGQDGTDTNSDFHVMPITYAKANAYATRYDGVITYEQGGDIYTWDWRRDPCGQFEIWDNIRPNLCEMCECCPWKIALFFDNEGKNRFSKMRVEFDERSYTHIDAKFIQHGFGNERVVLGEAKVINSRGFSIPRYSSSQTFIAELSSCAIMHEVRYATSSQELVNSSNATVE